MRKIKLFDPAIEVLSKPEGEIFVTFRVFDHLFSCSAEFESEMFYWVNCQRPPIFARMVSDKDRQQHRIFWFPREELCIWCASNRADRTMQVNQWGDEITLCEFCLAATVKPSIS